MGTPTKPRGICPVCQREFRLLKNGTVGPHGEPGVFPPENCAGWKKPATNTTEET